MGKQVPVPVYEEEIKRKSIETLEYIMDNYKSGEYTRMEAIIAFKTLYSATAGLVGNDIMTFYALAECEINDRHARRDELMARLERGY